MENKDYIFTKTNRSIGLLFVLFFLVQCARETTIDLPEEPPKTVIVGKFSEGGKFLVDLTRSQSVFSGADFDVLDSSECRATLSINGQYWDRLQYKRDPESGKYYWKSRKTAEFGIPYTIAVQVPGNPLVEATSRIPAHYGIEPLSISGNTVKTVTLPDSTFALRVPLDMKLSEVPDENRYFAFQLIYTNEVYRTVNGQTELNHTYEATSSYTTDGRTLALLNDISGVEPAVLINENFWTPEHQSIRLDAIIPYDPLTEKPVKLVVEWRTLSEEFYLFHLSLARQGNNLPLNDPDAVFNNVKNGYGNFSAFSVRFDTIQLP